MIWGTGLAQDLSQLDRTSLLSLIKADFVNREKNSLGLRIEVEVTFFVFLERRHMFCEIQMESDDSVRQVASTPST